MKKMKTIKKKKKLTMRGLSLFLALILCLGTLQTTVFAAEGDNDIMEISEEEDIEEETSEEETDEEETTEEDTSEDETSEEDASEDEAAEEETTEEETSNEETTEEETAEGETTDGETAEGAVPEGETAVEGTAEGEIPDAEAVDGAVTDGAAAEQKPANVPDYATVAELEAAFERVGGILDSGDVEGGIAALEEYIAIYNRLSPEDQAANAEAMAAAQAYLETLRASLEGTPDPDVSTMAAGWHIVTLVPASTSSYASKITSAKVRVKQKVNGYEVTSVSGTTIKVKAWGDFQDNFSLPRAADLWNGAVKSDYVNWGGTGVTSDKTEGDDAMLPRSAAYASYYFNTPGSVAGGSASSNFWNFTLKYSANGGSGAPEDQTYGTNDRYTTSHTFTISDKKPTRPDFIFKGWAQSATANKPDYQPGNGYPMSQTVNGVYNGGSVTKTLYAVWEPEAPKTVTLTYNANGGINPPTPATQNKGTEFTVKGEGDMTYAGYTFLGWSTDENAIKANIGPGDGITLDQDTTLYAVWEKEEDPVDYYTYELKYDGNKPARAEGEVDNVPGRQTSGSTAATTWSTQVSGESPALEGYTFSGWYLNKDGTGKQYEASETIDGYDPDNRSKTLYAKWVKARGPWYTVTYAWKDLPDGLTEDDLASRLPNDEGYEAGDEVTVKDAPADIEMDGRTYRFVSWETPEGLSVTDGKFNMPEQDVCIEGAWVENTRPAEYTVTVRYEDEDGREIRGSVTSATANGGRYDVTARKVDAVGEYKFKEVKGGSEGILKGITDKDITITLIYAKDPGTPGNEPDPSPTPDRTPNPTPNPTPDRTPGPTPNPTPGRTPNPTPNPNPTPDPVVRNEDPGTGGNEPEPVVAAQIPNQQPPLAQIPAEQPRLLDIQDERTPLARIPNGKISNGSGSLVEILDEEVPLAAVPKTGDLSFLWYAAVILSAAGLLVLAFMERRAKK